MRSASLQAEAATAAAFIALTSSFVANRPLMRGLTSAYALRLSYRIVFSKVLLFLFSRYLQQQDMLRLRNYHLLANPNYLATEE